MLHLIGQYRVLLFGIWRMQCYGNAGKKDVLVSKSAYISSSERRTQSGYCERLPLWMTMGPDAGMYLLIR